MARTPDLFANLQRELRRLQRQPLTIKVKPAADEDGYLERKCPRQTCGAIFKVSADNWTGEGLTYCVICREEAAAQLWHTEDQLDYLRRVGEAQLAARLGKAMKRDATAFNRSQPTGGLVRLSLNARIGLAPILLPLEAAKAMVQKLECEACGCRYAAVGAAFFCPACGFNSASTMFEKSVGSVEETIANLPVIRAALVQQAGDDIAADTCRNILERSVEQLVASFQRFAEALFQQTPKGGSVKVPRNAFQRLDTGSELWAQVGVPGYEELLPASDLAFLHRMFQERHLLAHQDGLVDASYLQKVPGSEYRVGQRLVIGTALPLRMANVLRGLAIALREQASRTPIE